MLRIHGRRRKEIFEFLANKWNHEGVMVSIFQSDVIVVLVCGKVGIKETLKVNHRFSQNLVIFTPPK